MEQVEEHGQPSTQQQEECEADTHDPGGPLVVPLAPGNGAQRRAAGSAQIGKGGDNVGNRHDQADAGKGVPADGVDMADKGRSTTL